MNEQSMVLMQKMQESPALVPEAFQVCDSLQKFRDLLTRTYLDTLPAITASSPAAGDLSLLKLITFSEIRFRQPADLYTGMQSLLTSISRYSIPFIFLLRRTENNNYHLYMGLWGKDRDQMVLLQNSFAAIPAAVRGFLPGCRFIDIDSTDINDTSCSFHEQKRSVWRDIYNLGSCRILTGIPSKKTSQAEVPIEGIDKLADSSHYPFAVLIYADPISRDMIGEFQTSVEKSINEIHKLGKISRQVALNAQLSQLTSTSCAENRGTSLSKTKADGAVHYEQPLSGIETIISNIKTVIRGGEKSSFQRQQSDSEAVQETSSITDTNTESLQKTQGINLSQSVEEIEKTAQAIEAILDRHLKRFEMGHGAGLWQCLTSVFADNDVHADEIANLFQGMLSGESSGDDPIRVIKANRIITLFNASDTEPLSEKLAHPFGITSAASRRLTSGIFTQLTTRELALLASLPQHELPGICVEGLVEYGRSWDRDGQEDAGVGIHIGNLIDRNQPTESSIHLSQKMLQRHCFVSGATGSGKSTTIKHLLCRLWQDCHIPFMVIEPVKSEYQELRKALGHELRFFRLGEDSFSLNPFAFDDSHIMLSSHLDMLKATFNASLGMYSSMPFILEHILYQVYRERGWDLCSGKNDYIEQLKRQGYTQYKELRRIYYPLLSDTSPMVQGAIHHFFGATHTDYSASLSGALQARLTSLVQGAKGQVFDQNATISFRELLSGPCVIELSNFSDNDEKALIMALLMTRLYEHRQAEERERQQCGGASLDKLRHVLVIEEAHRLLSRPTAGGDYTAQGRQKGVEVFADILAEVRSYGQGIVIADQIPSKLIPDVLRNTDVKIAHRIVDKEDRELIGATMNLEEKQIQELARLAPGEACIYFSGLRKALNVKITAEPPLEDGSHPSEAPKDTPTIGVSFYRIGTICLESQIILQDNKDFHAAGQRLRNLGIQQWQDLEQGMLLFAKLRMAASHDKPLEERAKECCTLLRTMAKYLQALLEDDCSTAENCAQELMSQLTIEQINNILDACARKNFHDYKQWIKALTDILLVDPAKSPQDSYEKAGQLIVDILSYLRGDMPGVEACLNVQYKFLAGSLEGISIPDYIRIESINLYKERFPLC